MSLESELQGDTRHLNPTTEREGPSSSSNLWKIVDDLQRSQVHLEEYVAASRKAVHQAYLNLTILQSHLEQEREYQSSILRMPTDVVGAEVMHKIHNQTEVKRKGDQDTQTQCGVGESEMRSIRRGSTSHSMCQFSQCIHSSYHLLMINTAGAGVSEFPDFAVSDLSHRTVDDNRNREFSHRGNPSPPVPEPIIHTSRTILNYSSDDKTITDDTYVDSDGTEKDFEDDTYSFLDSRGRSPQAELSERSELSSETDTSDGGTRWSAFPNCESDSDNSDYQLPDWDMEDIWELNAIWNDRHHPLFEFEYTEELRECRGVLSDAGLSTDDPDQGYNQVGLLRHFLMWEEYNLSLSLGHALAIPKWVNRTDYHVVNGMEFTPSPKLAMERYRHSEWEFTKMMAQTKFYPADFEQRLNDLLHSDHSQFYFDDEEWKSFAPYPFSLRQAGPPR